LDDDSYVRECLSRKECLLDYSGCFKCKDKMTYAAKCSVGEAKLMYCTGSPKGPGGVQR
jgi:hypothetical protein